MVGVLSACGDEPKPERPGASSASSCGPRPHGTEDLAGIVVPETVSPAAETEPVRHAGDAADDGAIWVHPEVPERSVIIGTDKRGGIAVYALDGSVLHERADGELNNVDLRCDHELLGELTTVVVAGNRTSNTIAIYRFDEHHRRLQDVAERPIEVGVTTYGSCLYQDRQRGALYYFATSHEGEVEQWALFSTERGTIDGRKVRSFTLGSTAEACAADDVTGDLYVSEEARGVWRLGAFPGDDRVPVLVARVEEEGGELVADVEGVDVARTDRGPLLFVSSQGNDSFAVYGLLPPHQFIGRFRVVDNRDVDGASNTDGIAVVYAAWGQRSGTASSSRRTAKTTVATRTTSWSRSRGSWAPQRRTAAEWRGPWPWWWIYGRGSGLTPPPRFIA